MTAEDQFPKKIDQLLASDPEMKKMYDMILSSLDTGDDGETEVEVVEMGEATYLIIKEFIVKGTTYFHLANESDPFDAIYRKLSIEEDGEEYLVPLESEHEFDMVVAYEQKYILQDLKRRQEFDGRGTGE